MSLSKKLSVFKVVSNFASGIKTESDSQSSPKVKTLSSRMKAKKRADDGPLEVPLDVGVSAPIQKKISKKQPPKEDDYVELDAKTQQDLGKLSRKNTSQLVDDYKEKMKSVTRDILNFATKPDARTGKNFSSYNPKNAVVASASFDEAVERCKKKVEEISKICRKRNMRFRDSYFDLTDNPLYAVKPFGWKGDVDEEGNVISTPDTFDLPDVRRVNEIFDKPKFFVDGCDPGDIMQGAIGTCYFLAAVASLANMANLIERICVARDEQVGVYGFVFFRDGEWVSVVIDDQLATNASYSNSGLNYFLSEKVYEEHIAKGSKSLYFTACKDDNETWMPLLEKAYAKIHGSYGAVDGGWGGEAIEDITGGVSRKIVLRDILDTDAFWKDELLKANTDRMFSVALMGASDSYQNDKDLVFGHAYSVLKTVEIDGVRLILLRNPWGKTEWKGKWSDGSSEWTPEWMQKLNHKFGDDGQFWMEYSDFLRQWTLCDRTRLFDNQWSVTSRWLSYQATIPATSTFGVFEFELTKEAPVVIVLSKLDMRYFTGIQGCYYFKISMKIVQILEEGSTEEALYEIVDPELYARSINIELPKLKPGTYRVFATVERQQNGLTTKDEQILLCGLPWLKKLETLLNGYNIKKAEICAKIAECEMAEEEENGYEDIVEEECEQTEDQVVPPVTIVAPESEAAEAEAAENEAAENETVKDEAVETVEGAGEEEAAAGDAEAEESEADEEIFIRLTIYSKDPEVKIKSASVKARAEIAELDPTGHVLKPAYDDPFADDLGKSSDELLLMVSDTNQKKLALAYTTALQLASQ
ncbi:hypothetical protein HK098_006202 [Nowakowskiella sp. JEL0407]|nr:hypothetical protein HK098_006202 [Nowakowskiella sp. JEL0407]